MEITHFPLTNFFYYSHFFTFFFHFFLLKSWNWKILFFQILNLSRRLWHPFFFFSFFSSFSGNRNKNTVQKQSFFYNNKRRLRKYNKRFYSRTTIFSKRICSSVSLSEVMLDFHLMESLKNGPAATRGKVSLFIEFELETSDIISLHSHWQWAFQS